MSQEISILIVEDEVLIAQDLKEILEETGYTEIFKARNYHQAIDALNAHQIDIVLLDINLNDTKSGIDLGNHIHQQLHIPLFILLLILMLKLLPTLSKPSLQLFY